MIGTNLKFLKNQKQKSSCAISYFLIFSGQFQASWNSTPGPSEAEKLIGSKKNRITSRGTVFRADTKKMSVGRAVFLKDCVYRRFKKICTYGNQGLINNLRAESI